MSDSWVYAGSTGYEENRGSNRGAAKLLGGLALGALLTGGVGSLLGPGNDFVGTWLWQQGSNYSISRFHADGSYWRKGSSGLIGFELGGTYRLVGGSGNVYRLHLDSKYGDGELELRMDSPDRLVELDSSKDGEDLTYRRVGDWVMARRPSSSAGSYEGETPHVGCWKRKGVADPEFEIRDDGTFLRHAGGETSELRLEVDYSKIPFHFDLTEPDGQVDREIFEFTIGGSLQISRSGSTERPKSMSTYQNYYPCEPSGSGGDA